MSNSITCYLGIIVIVYFFLMIMFYKISTFMKKKNKYVSDIILKLKTVYILTFLIQITDGLHFLAFLTYFRLFISFLQKKNPHSIPHDSSNY